MEFPRGRGVPLSSLEWKILGEGVQTRKKPCWGGMDTFGNHT